MSAAPATAALPNNPASQAGPAGNRVATQSRAGRVLSLLHKLIAYGQDLARTVQGHAAAATLFTVAVHFGTRDMALILARITRGLRLAAALETRLLSRPVRPDAGAAALRASVDRAIPASADLAKRTTRRAAKRPPLPDVPTAEEIAAALRHRPAAAVIADICRDLGIVPAHPLWGEVMAVLFERGGNFGKFFKDTMARLFGWLTDPSALDAGGWPG